MERSCNDKIIIWSHMAAILSKIASLMFLPAARLTRHWFVNTHLKTNYTLTRDLFNADCAYFGENGTRIGCFESDDATTIEGMQFWHNLGISTGSISPRSTAIVIGGYLFSFLIIVQLLDLAVTAWSCIAYHKFKEIISRLPGGLNKNSYMWFLILILPFLCCLLYVTITIIVICSYEESFIASPIPPSSTGESFRYFVLAALIYFLSINTLAVVVVLQIKESMSSMPPQRKPSDTEEGFPLRTLPSSSNR